ncbi:MAG: hypothetical protein EU532_04405 [Promethearchaeota archaeon]|nr:MAG: hypothetical protein EU532_04405 [Candidatus Lokiarchaeota archaeon]
MEVIIKLDTKVRNMSLILILIAVLILIIWTILYLNSPKRELQYLLYLGIALFLGGILVFTRIQFVLWAEKRVQKS